MADETIRLARYAAGLRYEDLPASVVQQAKDCIIDTVAAGICGSALPWSRIVIDYAERTGPGGKCRILGDAASAVQAPAAALANGALAACLRARQPDPARRRRASRRDRVAAGSRGRAAARRRSAGP